jgi:hypothetical protein
MVRHLSTQTCRRPSLDDLTERSTIGEEHSPDAPAKRMDRGTDTCTAHKADGYSLSLGELIEQQGLSCPRGYHRREEEQGS